MEPNRQKSRRKKGFWVQKSQPEIANLASDSFHRTQLNRNAALLSLVSEIESPLVYPCPKTNPNSDHGLSFPSPET